MAGKKDIVEQALKLIAGKSKEVGPKALRGKNTPTNAWHATEKPFTSYDWGLLGSATKPNVEGTSAENWAMDLARVGPWSSEKKIDLGFGTQMPVTVSGKGKAFNSLDDLQRAIAKAGGPDKFRQNMTAKGFGHLRVADEEFGGTSYVSLTPETFTVRDDPIDRASGGSIREGYGPGGWVDDVVKMAGKVFSPEEKAENLSRFVSGSKLFDEAGNPQRLYHITNKDFDVFKPGGEDPTISGPAIWLSPHPEKQPAMHNVGSRSGFKEGTNVMPVYARMKNPLVLDTPEMQDWARTVFANKSSEFPYLISPEAKKTMQDEGYDGIILGGGSDGEVIAFEGGQIKSAIGNTGAYDPNDPRIDRDTGGRISKGPGGWLDDVVKMAGKVISGEGDDAAKAGIRAYHASPHDFDKFEWSPRTSMTGEGAQSYGAGLYFAESPSVSGRGGTYDKQFTRKLQEIDRTGELGEKMGRVKIGGKPSTEYGIENDPGFIEAVKSGNVEKYARERLDRWHELSADEKYPYRDYATEKMRAWEKLLNDYSGGADVYYPMKARIYETNIAADPEKMMRWDEPLKDQPVEVMRGLGVLNSEDIAALQAEKRAIESKLQGGGWNDPIETQDPDEFWSKVNASVAKNSDDYSRLMKIERELSRAGKDIPDVTSGKFYKSSSERPENISLELRDRGVPGIQFWDGNSRGKSYLSQWRTDPLGGWTTDAFPSKGEATEYLNDVLRSAPALKGDERFSRVIQNPKATSNYVITNDKLISIIRKYGIAGASAMLGYNLMENLDPKQALAATMADKDYQSSAPQKADGGSVREGYAGKGRVVGSVVDEAVTLAKKLAGKATERQIITGADLLKKSPGLTEDHFKYSKFSKPLSEMEYTVEKLPMEEYKQLDPYDLVKQSALIAGHISDRTAAGRNLVGVGGDDLTEPLRQRGGADYQRTTLNAWANRPGAAKGLNRKLNEAAGYTWDAKKKEFVPSKGAGEAPLYTTPVFMGASSANSSHMVGVPLIRMIPSLPISKADKLAFDAMMSERFPGWPGIENTKAAEKFMYSGKIPGSSISNFIKYAAAKKWRGAGFPDVEEVMFSSMDPRLVGVPQGSTGFGFKEFSPGRTPIVKSNDYHPDYPAAIPGKEYAGGFKYQVPQSLMLPDWWNSLKPELRDPKNATKAQHTLMTQVPIQRATPEWADKILEYWEENPMPWGYAEGGAVEEDDDVNDALRIAKQEGGVLMEDAKGNKYDAQGNLIPPTTPGPNPARTPTPQQVGQKASMDPATFDALMQQYAVPDRDIAQYEATKAAVAAQPREIQQMTHVGDRPTRAVKVDMPLFGGEYSVGSAPYDVAGNMSGVAQTAYDLKTVPFYAVPLTAPIAAGMDVAEGIATNDPLTASLAIAFGPGGKYAKAAGIGAVNYFMDPSEAEAGPARWFSKAMEAAQAIPMEKMTGQQALAMLRKGVSQEELKWTGADVFLPQQKQITKQELVDYLAKNRVQTQDVIGGSGNKPVRREDVVADKETMAPFRDEMNELYRKKGEAEAKYNQLRKSGAPFSEQNRVESEIMLLDQELFQLENRVIDAQIEKMGGLGEPLIYGPGGNHGNKYYTKGGSDYRETRIILPGKGKPKVVKQGNSYTLRYPDNNPVFNSKGQALWYYDKADAERAASSIYRTSGKYQSSHWNEPDVIGHVRTQILDVTPPGANRPYKAFNVDEAQSDWAKDARELGFAIPNRTERMDELSALIKEANDKFSIEAQSIRDKFADAYNPINERRLAEDEMLRQAARRGEMKPREYEEASMALVEKYKPLTAPLFEARDKAFDELNMRHQQQDAILRDEYHKLKDSAGGVAQAPYVGSTQGWTDLSIKKALDQALDAGADYFTYTPGEVQAARYSLRNAVDEIQYDPENRVLFGRKNGKNVFEQDAVEPEELGKYVGKEMSEKLLSQPTKESKWYANPRHVLSGQQLEVGGEGMIDYYNNIYKKRVEKVVKDATGKKVQWEVIPVQTADGPREQLGFRITDMQDARFSDFNKGGRVTDRAKYADSDTISRALALTSEV